MMDNKFPNCIHSRGCPRSDWQSCANVGKCLDSSWDGALLAEEHARMVQELKQRHEIERQPKHPVFGELSDFLLLIEVRVRSGQTLSADELAAFGWFAIEFCSRNPASAISQMLRNLRDST